MVLPEEASRMTREQELAKNLALVREEIQEACSAAGRKESEVRLVGASKTKPWTDIQAMLKAGLKDFGENYAQEALEKKEKVPGAEWHFIGTLQSNKAKLIPGNFSLFHGLHSLTVAKKIDQRAAELNLVQNCLVEVNINDENSKGGIGPDALPELLENFSSLKNIKVTGLMCIPDPNKSARKAFSEMFKLKERLDLQELSMGMSHDFKDAILEGATIVRVGTALFGERSRK
jgi:pyridoxal phosphate enzyme (YggS family)